MPPASARLMLTLASNGSFLQVGIIGCTRGSVIPRIWRDRLILSNEAATAQRSAPSLTGVARTPVFLYLGTPRALL
jgi:hypothetical protein